jgi:hypothetical protein
MQNCVYLLSHQTGDLLKVNTACTESVQITNQFWRDGVNYDQGGFIAVCPESVLNQYVGDSLEVLVRYNSLSGPRFVATGVFLDRLLVDRRERT